MNRKSKINCPAKAVIFDMDGVITNTMPDHFRIWKNIFAEHGVSVSHYDVYSREGQKGITSIKEIFGVHGKPFDPIMAKKILAKKERIFKKVVRQRFIPGARNFLHFLHRRGFRLALVTGTSRHELDRILPLYLQNLFDVIISGSDVKNGKPNPEPYRKGLKRLRIKFSDAVVVENAPLGIESAKQAGLRCFAVETSLPKKYLQKADAHFVSIKELQSKVNFLLK